MKPNDHVLTSKGKLGKIILPGSINYADKKYIPASVEIGNRVFQIWPENLTVVSHITIKVMEGEITLTAQSAVNLIKVLLRNKLQFEIVGSTYSKTDISELEKQLFSYEIEL